MIDEAIEILDQWLALPSERTMVSVDEIQNVLLDIRQALLTQPVEVAVSEEPELVPA